MKKIFTIILLICFTLGVSAQHELIQTLQVVPAGGYPETSYPGGVYIQQPAESAQYINLIRSDNYAWSIGTIYNTNTFAISPSTHLESAFTRPDFTIKSGGEVGLGTSSPVSKLEISKFGLAPSSSLYNASYDILTITGSAGSSQGINIISAGDGLYNRGVLKATRSRGTPSAPTTVANGDVVMTLIGSAYNGTSNYATAGINTVVDGAVSSSLVPQALTFETGTGLSRIERMKISSGGNVGIGYFGTLTPGYSLDVQSSTITGMGNFQSTATTGSNRTGGVRARTNTAMGDFLAISNNANLPYSSLDGVYIMNRTSNGNMYFTTNNNGTEAKVMSVTSTGRVGIGTTSPDDLLTVKGTIHALEVKIDRTGPFADFVFKKEYVLRPLDEVHSFIKDNGHLPEIPSEEEVKKNGLNVADMQVKLLQKVEELTLYAIDQQKRIEALEKELRAVKNK